MKNKIPVSKTLKFHAICDVIHSEVVDFGPNGIPLSFTRTKLAQQKWTRWRRYETSGEERDKTHFEHSTTVTQFALSFDLVPFMHLTK